MLAAVLMLFVIFSFTGVAVLDLSSFTARENQDAVQSLKNQYSVESAVNVAMWKINHVASLAQYTDGPVTVAYDSLYKELTVSVDRYDKQYSVALDLSDDDHFNHNLASANGVNKNGYAVSGAETSRDFGFLPDVDLDYLNDNAVDTHSGYFKSYSDEDLAQDGIHIIDGSFITIDDVHVNGTLVFTGRFIFFNHEVHVTADTSSSLPAMVFTNPQATIWFHENSPQDDFQIIGPVFCAGRIWMRDGEFSGPIIGERIDLEANFNFNMTHAHKYYKWNHGFGNRSDYEWPKHIGRWRVHAH